MKNMVYNEFLEQVYISFFYENQEIKITHQNCPVYNFFCGVTLYLFDFPEGIVKTNGELAEKLNVGVWNDTIDEASYIIRREAFGKYSFECIEEDMRDFKKGTILLQKKSNISIDTLQDLAIHLKKEIINYLNNIQRTDILKLLETHYCWTLKNPISIEEYLDWKRDGLW